MPIRVNSCTPRRTKALIYMGATRELKFCPKCNSRLILDKVEGQTVFMCSRSGCGYQEPANEVKVVVSVENQGQDVIKVLDKGAKELQPIPTTRALCPKCGHNKAYFWLVQTRGADESPTQFFRCVRCNNTWREYS